MSTAEVENEVPLPTEANKVVEWRKKELIAAGFNEIHANRIAERHQGPDAIDLHEAIALVREKGAPPHLAADIVL